VNFFFAPATRVRPRPFILTKEGRAPSLSVLQIPLRNGGSDGLFGDFSAKSAPFAPVSGKSGAYGKAFASTRPKRGSAFQKTGGGQAPKPVRPAAALFARPATEILLSSRCNKPKS